MSSRTPSVPPAGIPSYRKEDDRRRDEARLSTLQNQVDEIRQAIRELASRQVRMEENVKQYEGSAAQNRLVIDQVRQESAQSAQARALDENRTRQQVADLEQRLDDGVRPIRSLQAHVSELLEASRKKVDDSSQVQRRFDELRTLIDNLQALGDRNAVVTHQLRDTLDGTRREIDQVRRDLIRNEDAVKIVDQEARRRVAEVGQVVETFSARLDELRSDLAHAFDLIEETKRSIVHVDPTLGELREADAATRIDVNRIQAQAIERHEVLAERIDDVRSATETIASDLRNSTDERFERINDRLEALNEEHRELGYKLSTLNLTFDELRQVDASLRRDIWSLHEQRIRMRLEQVQQELDAITGQRRTAEAASQPEPAPTEPPTIRSLDL